MQIETSRFGRIEVNDASVIETTEGLLGFDACRGFVLLEEDGESRFRWLQSVDFPDVAFVVINPLEFFSDYDVELSDEQAEWLGLTDPCDAVMLTTVTVGKQPPMVTTNLVGPIVINAKTLRARQIVLGDERYGPRHIIGEEPSVIADRPRAMAV